MNTRVFFADLKNERLEEALVLEQGFGLVYTFLIGRRADSL